MDRHVALAIIQRMHEARTVTNEGIIAWYSFYAHKLPTMHPWRSDVDLIRTVALWMELTNRGGSPGFPFEYRSALSFPTIKPTEPPRPNISWLVGSAISLVGLVVLLFSWKIALGMIIGGQVIHFAGYRLAGGPTNPDLLKEGTKLYKKEGKRVLEWACKQQHPQESGS